MPIAIHPYDAAPVRYDGFDGEVSGPHWSEGVAQLDASRFGGLFDGDVLFAPRVGRVFDHLGRGSSQRLHESVKLPPDVAKVEVAIKTLMQQIEAQRASQDRAKGAVAARENQSQALLANLAKAAEARSALWGSVL